MSPDEWAAEAKRAYTLGYRLHQIKARPWFEIREQVSAISEAVPADYQFRVDANDSFETPERTLESGCRDAECNHASDYPCRV